MRKILAICLNYALLQGCTTIPMVILKHKLGRNVSKPYRPNNAFLSVAKTWKRPSSG